MTNIVPGNIPDPGSDPDKIADPGSTVSRADPAGVGDEAQGNIEEASPGDDEDRTKLLPKASREDAPQLQFPSIAGNPGVEVAERSADVSAGRTRKHRKVFRVFVGSDLSFSDMDFDHGPNRVATRQYMVSHGLRPLGDVAFVGAEPYDERNVDLTYEVEAVPAAIATQFDEAHVVVALD